MALDLSPEALDRRIDSLRSAWAGHNATLANRHRVYLKAVSPEFDSSLGEHDQWPDPVKPSDDGHYRSSFNMTRAVVEMWSALEASEFPAIRWQKDYVPTPVPTGSDEVDEQRDATFRAQKAIVEHLATLRESVLNRHVRAAKLPRAFFRWTIRKNTYGHAWLKLWPDLTRRRFQSSSRIDPSTVYPVWSAFEDNELDAVLVAYRVSAQRAAEQFPGCVILDRDGLASEQSYFEPTHRPVHEADRKFVWVEDYWIVDREFGVVQSEGGPPRSSRVVNAIRVNGKLPYHDQVDQAGEVVGRDYYTVHEYQGWRRLPFFYLANDNLRDHSGFSDAGTMLPFQDAHNRFLSQQGDVIEGESRPRFIHRGDSERTIEFGEEDVIPLELDEDLEQLQVSLNVFPTQVHGQQLAETMNRATGLPDTVWGRIVQATNSGRALATAWRATALRLVPRGFDDEEALEMLLSAMVDWMVLYDWNEAEALYGDNRDFELDFPNKEPRDFTEVTLDAINRMNAGILDQRGAMEATGEASPDEMAARVRADYDDETLHPEKKQAKLMLRQLELQMAAMVQQMQAAAAEQQMTAAQAQGASAQANAEAEARAAPQLGPGQQAPATQAGARTNPAQGGYQSTMVQDGRAYNRLVDRRPYP